MAEWKLLGPLWKFHCLLILVGKHSTWYVLLFLIINYSNNNKSRNRIVKTTKYWNSVNALKKGCVTEALFEFKQMSEFLWL